MKLTRKQATTEAFVRRSQLMARLHRFLPEWIFEVRTRTPFHYLRGAAVNRAYRRYHEEARRLWQPGALHEAESTRRIARALQSHGAACASLGELLHEEAEDLLRRLDTLFASNENLTCMHDYRWYLPEPAETFEHDPPQYVFLKDESLRAEPILSSLLCTSALLAPMEAALGCHVRLVSVYAYRSYRNRGRILRNMQYHHDNQPPRAFKWMLLLDDVGEDQGPLEYLVGSYRSVAAHPGVGYTRLKDAPASDVLRFTGSRGTCFYFDNNGYHRGGNVRSGRRTVLIATYRSSKIPGVEHVERYGFGGYLQEDTWGRKPDQPWW